MEFFLIVILMLVTCTILLMPPPDDLPHCGDPAMFSTGAIEILMTPISAVRCYLPHLMSVTYLMMLNTWPGLQAVYLVP